MTTALFKKIGAWVCQCGNCSHEWFTRSDQLPKVCPKCKSAKWSKVKKEKQ